MNDTQAKTDAPRGGDSGGPLLGTEGGEPAVEIDQEEVITVRGRDYTFIKELDIGGVVYLALRLKGDPEAEPQIFVDNGDEEDLTPFTEADADYFEVVAAFDVIFAEQDRSSLKDVIADAARYASSAGSEG